MRSRKFTKFGAILVIFALMIVLATNVFAATVGQALTSPETGWQRIDDTDTKIVYNGPNWTTTSYSQYYGGTCKHVTDTTSDSSYQFKFEGTKFRLISQMDSLKSTGINIEIDGILVDTASLYISNVVQPNGCQYLNYEKTGLTNAIHTVKVTRIASGGFSLDAIDIDDTGRLIPYYQPINLQATPGDSKVTLTWDAIPDATEYTIKYGTSTGNYTETISSVSSDAFTGYNVTGLTNGTPYFFVVSAIVGGVEREISNEAFAIPQASIKALLEITMVTGEHKEYELTMDEINNFISWYNSRAAISPTFIISKAYNKGPFKSRKDYIVFDKICNFEVMEY